MARASHARRVSDWPSWLATAVGVIVLIGGGLALGLVVGLVAREPDLVAGHLAGRSQEVIWDDTAGVRERRRSPVAPEDAEPSRRSVGMGPRVAGDAVHEAALPDVAAAPLARVDPPKRADASAPASFAGKGEAGGYAVQVGAFSDQQTAWRLARGLAEKGFRSYVVEPIQDHRWRVRVGKVAGKPEAENLARRLKREQHLPTWVLTERGS